MPPAEPYSPPPDPQVVGRYVTACASGATTADRKLNSVTTIERRLSSLSWNYAQRGGEKLDRNDRAIAFAAGLRRSEIVGLDLGRDQTEDGRGWIEILDKGLLVTLRGKTGWREVEIGHGSSDTTCPVVAVETWIKFARIARGPLFRRVRG